ncbi:hypothetical protein CL176_04775 [Suicoccus acidiformans]|uniref:Peptidase M13 C-terminal domain-containing protein n=1 Tax=Suicoccus acidiformans TaxID=2036206 RepID=A0A347WJW1_9LACT|nr:hypothetical protein CL176_04775 [Suicoccus acidiformans]
MGAYLAQLTTNEMASLLLQMDVHAPSDVRVNIPITNFDEFYETFNIQAGGLMYRAPDERLVIW